MFKKILLNSESDRLAEGKTADSTPPLFWTSPLGSMVIVNTDSSTSIIRYLFDGTILTSLNPMLMPGIMNCALFTGTGLTNTILLLEFPTLNASGNRQVVCHGLTTSWVSSIDFPIILGTTSFETLLSQEVALQLGNGTLTLANPLFIRTIQYNGISYEQQAQFTNGNRFYIRFNSGTSAPEWVITTSTDKVIRTGTSLSKTEGSFVSASLISGDRLCLTHLTYRDTFPKISILCNDGLPLLSQFEVDMEEIVATSGRIGAKIQTVGSNEFLAFYFQRAVTQIGNGWGGETQQGRFLICQLDTIALNLTERSLRATLANTSLSSDLSVVSSLIPGSTAYIEKQVVSLSGWRYMIGLRGLDIFNKTFVESSSIITKPLRTKRPITKISLEVSEIIPPEFLEYGLPERNNWLTYQISINGMDWYPISPLHHNPIGDAIMPPKIYEVGQAVTWDQDIRIRRGLIRSTEPIYEIRLKITSKRPSNRPDLTPVLEEYTIRCNHEGGAL